MRWHRKFSLRLRSLFKGNSVDRELDAELQFHLQQQIDEYMAQGMSGEQARYSALHALGGVEQVKEQCRRTRQVEILQNAVQDIRFGTRSLAKKPGFALAVLLTLALGIGVNSSVFSLVYGILLKPLPYAAPDRLMDVWEHTPKGIFVGFKEHIRSMEIAAHTMDLGFNLTSNGEAARLTGSEVSFNLFSMLGVQPHLGRLFRSSDEQPGQSRVVILSYGLWQTRFGGNTNIIGRSIIIDDAPWEVVGVMPPGFQFPSSSTQLWLPIEVNISRRESLWGYWQYYVIGRLAPGVSFEAAQSEFKAVVPTVMKEFPYPMPAGFGAGNSLGLLQDARVGNVRTRLLLLLGAVLLVLLIASANVANLLLVRAANRQTELTLRIALGASRRRIIAQLLTESLLLALMGGALGILLAFSSERLLRAAFLTSMPRLATVTIDMPVLIFTLLISIVTGLSFGIAPALHASKPDIEEVLRRNAQALGIAPGRARLSAILVAAEIALAVILVSGSGLLIKNLWLLSSSSTGFSIDQILTAKITPSTSICRKTNSCVDYYRQLLDQAHRLPGMKNAAVVDSLPLDSTPLTTLAVEDRADLSSSSPYFAWGYEISPGYLDTMGIPLLTGRAFNELDGPGSPGVVLVSRSLAQALWPGQIPIGKRVRPSIFKTWRVVVGVVDDVKEYKVPLADWMRRPYGDIYFPDSQGVSGPRTSMTLVIQADARADLASLARALPGFVASINSSVPVSELRNMHQIVSDAVAAPRSVMWLFLVFAGLALVLGVVGIYSIISYIVTQRTHEIGIRMAIGANQWDVLRIVLRRGVVLTFIGLAVGLAGAMLCSRLMASLLYGMHPTDPATFIVVSVIVASASLIATYVPARRATKVAPTIALKYE
jgi:putative ABC transport system permease protein